MTLGLTLPPLAMSLRPTGPDHAVLFLVAMLAGVLVGLILSAGGIQPKEMGRADMQLEGFSPAFVHAVEDNRVGGDAGRPRASADFVTLTRA